MKSIILLIGLLIATPAVAETYYIPNSSILTGTSNALGAGISGTVTISSAGCSPTNQDDCVKSDLVAIIGGKMVLIRGLYGCKAVAAKIDSAPDVRAAECFPEGTQ